MCVEEAREGGGLCLGFVGRVVSCETRFLMPSTSMGRQAREKREHERGSERAAAPFSSRGHDSERRRKEASAGRTRHPRKDTSNEPSQPHRSVGQVLPRLPPPFPRPCVDGGGSFLRVEARANACEAFTCSTWRHARARCEVGAEGSLTGRDSGGGGNGETHSFFLMAYEFDEPLAALMSSSATVHHEEIEKVSTRSGRVAPGRHTSRAGATTHGTRRCS